MFEDISALVGSKERKPPLYSPPPRGGDKKLNIIELTPHPSEGGGRGEVGRFGSKAPMFEPIAALFFFKARPFGEGLGGVRNIAAMFCFIAALFGVIAALVGSKARKPPLYSPPTLGGDKKLNIIELTPHPSEGGGRGEVGRFGSKAPMFEPIAALFFFKARPFGEGLGGVRNIAAMFCFIAALVGVIAALFRSKARKPPLYSPPTLGGDKKLNIIELTPHPSEGGGRGEVGRFGSKAPMFEPIAALFFFKARPFGEGLGGVRNIAAMFCFIAALVGVISALFRSKARKPPLYSPPLRGGDKKLNIIELTPPSSEGCARGEVGRFGSKAPKFDDIAALVGSKARKPPLYSPPPRGEDKKLNIIELTPPPSEGGGRGEVGRVYGNAPMFEPIASLFSIKALSFGEGLGGVRVIDALVGVIAALFRSKARKPPLYSPPTLGGDKKLNIIELTPPPSEGCARGEVGRVESKEQMF